MANSPSATESLTSMNMDMDVLHPTNSNLDSYPTDSQQVDQIRALITADQGSSAKTSRTCHQCRQKIKNLAAHCQFLKKNKQCMLKFCTSCLFTRYGEKLEEVDRVDGWKCPKCRGICNCSICMKKQGKPPTGVMIYRARASGFSSVLDMIRAEDVNVPPMLDSSKNLPTLDKTCEGHEASLGLMEMDDVEQDVEPAEVENVLPHGTVMTSVADAKFSTEDVGNALQFVEFCYTFGEALDITKSEAESILYDLTVGSSGTRKSTTFLVKFHIKLLTLIMGVKEKSQLSTTDGKNCWLEVLKKCIFESQCIPKDIAELKLDTCDGYCALSSSEKLRLLVFICDEALGSTRLRSWMEEQNLKFKKKKKETRGILLAAKEKEKSLKKRLHDEVMRATTSKNDASFSIDEHEAIVSQLKADIEHVHAEILEIKDLLPKNEQKLNALRTEPVFINANGGAFWNLKGFDKSDLLRQDLSNADEEKWFSFEGNEVQVISSYISSQRVEKPRHRHRKLATTQPLASIPTPELLDPNPSKVNEGS